MFWKSATVLQTWHWEVLTIFRKATQKLPYLSQENMEANLKNVIIISKGDLGLTCIKFTVL